MSSISTMSSSTASSSTASSYISPEVSLGYDVEGLEKVTQAFHRHGDPIITFQFKEMTQAHKFISLMNFNEKGRTGGFFSSSGELGGRCMQFTGTEKQSHIALIKLIQNALREVSKN